MRRQTVILPFSLPCLTDKAAAQFVGLLHQLMGGIEHHYADQVHRYHKQQANLRYRRASHTANPTDPPF